MRRTLFLILYLSSFDTASPTPLSSIDAASLLTPLQLPITLSSLAIGGGGFTTGIVPSFRTANGTATVFFRTDVGGVYRLVHNDTWKPLIDFFTYKDRNRYGGDAIAVSAQNAAKVWISLGAYFNEPGNALILSSENAGDTWRIVSPSGWIVRAGSNNSTLRSLGERLAVHPNDDRGVILYGSYLDGLWRTESAGSIEPEWKEIVCGETSGLPCNLPYGALAIAFDAESLNGDAVYASIPTAGVIRSLDAGQTWTLLTGGPVFAKRFAFAFSYRPSNDIIDRSNTSPLFASAQDGIWEFDGESSTWTLNEPFGKGVAFSGIDVNPFDPSDVIAISEQVNGIARSRDGGKTWAKVMDEYLMIYELPWWVSSFTHNNTPVSFVFGMCGNIKFGTSGYDNGNTIFLGDSWNVWRASNFNIATNPPSPSGMLVSLQQMPRGHEEVFVLSMMAPHTPFPFLLTGTADLAGLLHEMPDWTVYSNWSFFGPGAWGAEGTAIAYTEALTDSVRDGIVPARIAVAQTRAYAASNGPMIQLSDDGGRTWRATAFNESVGAPFEVLGIAISAWNKNSLVALVGNSVPWYSIDGGDHWSQTTAGSVPVFSYPIDGFSGNRYNQSRPLVADRSLLEASSGQDRFYYSDCASGSSFISADGGKNFIKQPSLSFPPSSRCILEPHPTIAGGALWLALNEGGLMFTLNASTSFIQIGAISFAHAVAVGAPRVEGGEPAVYVVGLLKESSLGDDLHVVVSLDRGLTWADLRALALDSGAPVGLGNWPEVIVASRAHFGVVGVGSFGRGAYFFNASSVL